MKGAILPFDNSYKGTGLGMIVELLAGALTGASYVFDEGDWGTTYIAISPELLIGTEEFKKNSSDLILKVKQSKVKEGQKIKIPGYNQEKLK
jgi:LDH2 family malate/lactate/ureidoglycolate dehydrogenase